MDVSQRHELSRDLNRQSGSFELALVPLIFSGAGYALDRWLGLVPLFTLLLLLVGAVGVVISLWVGYDQEMRRHEKEGLWSQNR